MNEWESIVALILCLASAALFLTGRLPAEVSAFACVATLLIVVME